MSTPAERKQLRQLARRIAKKYPGYGGPFGLVLFQAPSSPKKYWGNFVSNLGFIMFMGVPIIWLEHYLLKQGYFIGGIMAGIGGLVMVTLLWRWGSKASDSHGD